MSRVLLLIHRIPYPPNKGDKIRSFNLLKQLASQHEVYLGAFVDDDADWGHEGELRKWCAEVFLRPLDARVRKVASLRGLVTGEPLTVPYYCDAKMARWVEACVDQGIEQVVVFSSAMAQYVNKPQLQSLTRIVDLVDVDSEKWRAYAPRHRWPMSWVYRREARRLLAYERAVAANFDASVLVSPQEADLFRTLAPESRDRIFAAVNGVDTDYFSPSGVYSNPYRANEQVLVFTGAMDYWANVDAVSWFAESILPQIRQQIPQARFYIVGSRPTEQVRALGQSGGIVVTGSVPDIRPYLAHAAMAVAPLRIARGIQNKVLEAFAMGRPVLATSAAMEGIVVPDQLRVLTCDQPAEFVAQGIRLLKEGDQHGYGRTARETVLSEYSWSESFALFDQLLKRFSADRIQRRSGKVKLEESRT